ncbi:DNA integrity scanning protein DisA with diadenylate cyclase activity [Methanococcus voltae]|uniref:diadenylate cyclase n=1 Tax=Methanococcus voltae TaxID=2188 RepID=UPI001AE8FE6A|nr:diadenylate cyclase [Methanococcus voltae]MBP2143732.1 DNA integrity scanning protein DisA with diadenylate cyclase activity [Methanococcus voltae]
MDKIKYVIRHGLELSNDLNADTVLIFTESGSSYEQYKKIILENPKLVKTGSKVIVATPNKDTYFKLKNEPIIPILMNYGKNSRVSTVNQAMIVLLENGLLNMGELIVSIFGTSKISLSNNISVLEVDDYPDFVRFYKYISSLDDIKRKVILEALNIGIELSVEGREGKPVGTTFLIGEKTELLKMTTPLILNPFECHDAIIFDKKVKGTLKELSTIDGAFLIDYIGNVFGGGRYINCGGATINLPHGLGARHYSAATITKYIDCVAITLSASGGIVRVFDNGEILAEFKPNS